METSQKRAAFARKPQLSSVEELDSSLQQITSYHSIRRPTMCQTITPPSTPALSRSPTVCSDTLPDSSALTNAHPNTPVATTIPEFPTIPVISSSSRGPLAKLCDQSAEAIDQKIAQAMTLVEKHLQQAMRLEMVSMQERITELKTLVNVLSKENAILREVTQMDDEALREKVQVLGLQAQPWLCPHDIKEIS